MADDAKALQADAIASIGLVKSETPVTKALTPTMLSMSESLRSLQNQKLVSKCVCKININLFIYLHLK